MIIQQCGWMATDGIITVLAGYLGPKDQACYIIFMNISNTFLAIPLGVNSAACTFVGNFIGEGNVASAKKYMHGVFIF